ncbi:MAG: hypothetical protein PHN88_15670 [Ignavibacteria bacterium]|nr:hypothetical protein [Ignavibacteria bacterium]
MPKSFIIKLCIFILTVSVGINAIHSFSKYIHGFAYPSQNDYRRIYFENPVKNPYDLLITGNSKIVNGVNPDLLEIGSFNFASQGESMPVTYAKLNFLEKNNRCDFRYIILGLDYFSFSFSDINDDSYMLYLPPDEKLQPTAKQSDISLNENFNRYMNSNYASDWNVFFMTLFRMASGKNPVITYFKENGQMVQRGVASDNYQIIRNIETDTNAVKYFIKSLAFAKKHGIDAVIVFPPSTKKELANYSGAYRMNFDRFVDSAASKYDVKGILNYTDSTGFELRDFLDVAGHLNENGANKFTAMLNRDVMKIFGRKND